MEGYKKTKPCFYRVFRTPKGTGIDTQLRQIAVETGVEQTAFVKLPTWVMPKTNGVVHVDNLWRDSL